MYCKPIDLHIPPNGVTDVYLSYPESCNKMLESTNVCEHEKKLYCRNCHGKNFGPKGYGFGGGAGTLSMDTGTSGATPTS